MRILRLVAACLASCLAAGAAQAASAADLPAGGIYVTTLPSGADVFLDGTYVGHAPVLVGGLDRGHHALTLTKSGWAVAEVDVTVAAGTVVTSSTRLASGARVPAQSAAGTLIVRGLPPGASLLLDGTALPATVGTSVSVPAGTHHVTLVTAHGRSTRALEVFPETATDLVLSEPHGDEAKSAVVAPAEDYLPTDNFTLEREKVVVRYAGHVVVARVGETLVRFDGTSRSYDAAPQVINGKLYLPLRLLETLSGDESK